MSKSNTKKVTDDFQLLVSRSHNYFKGVNVSRELLTYSNSLLNDLSSLKKKSKRKFIPYQRGTIVYVDFGLNVGAELCGPHYAIILNKHDNPTSAKVTVVPLTSKKGKFNYPLPDGINRVLGIWYAETGLKRTLQQPNEYQLNKMVEQALWEKIAGYDSPTEKALNKSIEKYHKDIKFIRSELDKQLNDLKKVSYFKIDNVATISKFRIRKQRHEFDPLGKVGLPSADMDIIDQQISQHILDN